MVLDKGLGNVGGSVGGTGGGAGAIKPAVPHNANRPDQNGAVGNSTFGNVLDKKLSQAPSQVGSAANVKTEGLRFSQHALERMSLRGVSIKPEDMARLNDAVDRAAAKGSKQSLILMGDNALIVSVKNKTVVTAMDREAMKENIFTNIDSTMLL